MIGRPRYPHFSPGGTPALPGGRRWELDSQRCVRVRDPSPRSESESETRPSPRSENESETESESQIRVLPASPCIPSRARSRKGELAGVTSIGGDTPAPGAAVFECLRHASGGSPSRGTGELAGSPMHLEGEAPRAGDRPRVRECAVRGFDAEATCRRRARPSERRAPHDKPLSDRRLVGVAFPAFLQALVVERASSPA